MNQRQHASIGFTGEQTLRTCGKARQDLLAVLGDAEAVDIDCSDTTEIDLSFLQVLLAFARSAAAHDIPVAFVGETATLAAAIERCGLSDCQPFQHLRHPEEVSNGQNHSQRR